MNKERIGDYELKELMGTGTVGTVYRAVNTKTGDEVALKILLPELTQDENISTRFRREMQVLERLSHPNIVQYYDDGLHNGQLYYTMELVEGGSLKDILKTYQRLTWQDVIEIGWQVCSALQHAHNQGIIHRDLKPGNLFLTKSDKLKLGDFGLAYDVNAAEITSQGMTVGTYHYMAPEQIRGERTISGQTDLYALGCLLFRMLAGRPPYEGTNIAHILDLHLNAPIPMVKIFTPDCPPELESLIHRLLAKKQQERPFNAREVQGILAEILMKWDESQAEESVTNQPKTWAIDIGRPILSNLRREIHGEPSNEISWLAIAGSLAALICFIYLASIFSS